MDHKRISKLIKKISQLNQSIEEDGEFSSIEKEHMLSYIQKLFEEVEGEIPQDVEEEEVIEIVEEEDDEEIEQVMNEEKIDELEPPMEVDDSLIELFSDASGNELSDKLASRPIKDLTKAMGINERIFTVNELFGGNQKEFENLMVALDGLSSFDEAKGVLIGSVAEKYEWASEAKQKKATGFIKLVRRRFN